MDTSQEDNEPDGQDAGVCGEGYEGEGSDVGGEEEGGGAGDG